MTAALVLAAALGTWPEYPRAAPVRLDLAGGPGRVRPERAEFFVTPDPLADVAAHVVAAWEAAGLATTADGDFLVEAVVAAYDVRAQRQFAVVLVRLPDRRTLAFVTATSFAELQRAVTGERTPALEVLQIEARSRSPRVEVDERGRSGGDRRAEVRVSTGTEEITWERRWSEQEAGR